MTHDDAVAALESLPDTTRITYARLRPTDIIVIEYPGILSDDVIKRMTAHFKGIWPDNTAIVLEQGTTMKIVEGAK